MDTQLLNSQNFIYLSLGIALAVYTCYVVVLSPASIYEKEQWVGRKREEWFSKFRASLRALNGMKVLADEGHLKYSKSEKVYILPEFSLPPKHVLPPSQIANVLKQPESNLNHKALLADLIQNRYTIRDPRITHNNIHFDIVRHQLTRNLDSITPALAEELGLALEKEWGTDSENWKDVNMLESLFKIVSRAANRTLVGPELCRNEKFTSNCAKYAQAVFSTSTLIRLLLPKWSRPIFAPLIARPTKTYLALCCKESRPLIENRLRMNKKIREDPEFKLEVPNDFLQWLIEETYTRDVPEERSPELLAKRICMVNMVAIHTTTMTSATTILDLYSSSRSQDFLEGLREECTKMFGGGWVKGTVTKLLRVDSAVRESMRHSNLGVLALQRIVTVPEGLTLDHGIHIPNGAHIAFSADSIHHDEDIYPDPLNYDAFRFSRPREAYEAERALKESHAGDAATPQEKQEHLQRMLEFKQKSAVAIGDDFLPFGRGKHACPGRFFASNEIKMLIAFIVMNYEIEHMAERAKDKNVMGNISPSDNTVIRVKRRAGV